MSGDILSISGHSQMCSGDYSKAMMSYQHIIDTNGASGHLLSKVAVCFNNLGKVLKLAEVIILRF